MKRLLIIAVILDALHSPAVAQEFTALNLIRQCEGKAPAALLDLGPAFCGIYAKGLADMHAFLTDENLPVEPTLKWYCAPALATDQVIRVLNKYAADHPEALHNTARTFFLTAMAKAFPCS